MSKKPSLYHQLLELAYSLSVAVEKGKVYTDFQLGDMYSHQQTAEEDYFLKQSVAIIDLELFDNLSAHACKFLLRIIKEMKMNNVFWIAPNALHSRHRAAVAELKRHEILLHTEQQNLFIINPFKLRRGKPMSSIMASIRHYHKDNSVFKLEDLRPPAMALISIGK